ncbi:MAG: hypothetical protein WCT03_05800 [Candidatus Obscuribacterales bacterium]
MVLQLTLQKFALSLACTNLLFYPIALDLCWPANAIPNAAPKAATKALLVVNFPRSFSIGTLTVRQPHQGVNEFTPLGPAQGTIRFNSQYQYALDANHLFFLHPEVLKDIPPDSLDTIRMRFSSFDDAEDGLCDKAMKYVAGLTGLKKLNLDRSEVTDIGLSQARNLVNLESLTMFSTLAKGKAFKDLAHLKKLRAINIPLNDLVPEAYECFSGYPNLTELDVGRCHPNDQAMKSIAKCTNLIDLDISGNQTVNDQNIKYLVTLKHLKTLKLFGTSVSLTGLAQLKDLPLKLVMLPQRVYEPAKLAAISKVFPHTKLIAKGREKINGNDQAIFAPLH